MTGKRGVWERVLLRRPGEEPEGSLSKREKREEDSGKRDRAIAPEEGYVGGGGEEERARGLWMSGRQCRDAKGGIEVSPWFPGGERREWNE